MRADAAIFIQYWARFFKISQSPRKYDVSERLTIRFKFVTARNTFTFKRKSLANDIPTLDEVFTEVEKLSTAYYDKFHRKCVRIKLNIIPRIEDCSDYQYELDVSFLKLFDLVHRCYSFLAEIDENKYGTNTLPQYESIDDVTDYYDLKQNRGNAVRTFRNYKLQLIDARIPITSLHEGIMEIDQRLKNPEKKKRGFKSGGTIKTFRTMKTLKTARTLKSMKSAKDGELDVDDKSP